MTFLEWKKQATAFQGLNAFSGRGVNLATQRAPGAGASHGDDAGVPVDDGPPLRARTRLRWRRKALSGARRSSSSRTSSGWTASAAIAGSIGRPIRIDGNAAHRRGHPGRRSGRPHAEQAVRAARVCAGAGEPRLPLAARHGPDEAGRDARAGEREHEERHRAASRRRFPPRTPGWSASVEPLKNNFLSDNTKTALWLLLGAVGFVLLIACANVANLLLARGTARQRELAVRASVGASPATIARQLIVESLVLAMAGGALGVALAYALVRVIMAHHARVHAAVRGGRAPERAGARCSPSRPACSPACSSGACRRGRRRGRTPARR